jgi:hypothetical protein
LKGFPAEETMKSKILDSDIVILDITGFENAGKDNIK